MNEHQQPQYQPQPPHQQGQHQQDQGRQDQRQDQQQPQPHQQPHQQQPGQQQGSQQQPNQPHQPNQQGAQHPQQPSPATSSPGAERRDEDRAKDAAAKQAHDQRVQHGEAGAKLGATAAGGQPQQAQQAQQQPAAPPASAADSTRAAFGKGADEAAARQQMRQSGLAGVWHDDVIDLMPALGTPPKAAPTLSEVIDLVKEHDRGAVETLRRVYGLPPGQPK